MVSLTIDCRADVEILLTIVLPAESYSRVFIFILIFILLWDGLASNSSALFLVTAEVVGNPSIVGTMAWTVDVDLDEEPPTALLLLSELDVKICS